MVTEKNLLSSSRDTIFELQEARRFAFGSEVAEVFDDMVSRSVPGYFETQMLMGAVAARYHQPDTAIVDLGCSTGTTLGLIARQNQVKGCQLVGVDNSAPMLEKAGKKLHDLAPGTDIELHEANLQHYSPPRASVIFAHYTLQFLPIEQRKPLIERICSSLVPGGAFVLSEKVAIPRFRESEIVRELHEDFKRANGYSDIEIARKRESISGVLVPTTENFYRDILFSVGFEEVTRLMQGYQFTTWLCLTPRPQENIEE
jgi:tRNA (cmo5U34)-methyltransferase